MKVLAAILLMLIAAPLQAAEYEANITGSWGKRLIDGFDRRWPKLRYQNSEIEADEDVQNISYIRNIANFNARFLVSPLFKHYFGVSFAAMFSMSDGFLESKIGTTTHQTTMSVLVLSPALSYKYHPFAESKTSGKNFYLGAEIGLGFGTIEMGHRQSGGANDFTETIQYTGIIAARMQGRIGMKFPIGKGFAWLIEAGIDATRLDDIEGTTSRQGETRSVGLKRDENEVAAIEVGGTANVDDFTGFENSTVWINQFAISLGLAYSF